jgi:hypothetical protein
MGWAGFFGWPMKAQACRPLVSCAQGRLVNEVHAHETPAHHCFGGSLA